METYKIFTQSIADDIRHQEENHYHCLTGFYNINTDESFNIIEISSINLDSPLNDNIDIKINNDNNYNYVYDKKNKVYEYFKNLIRNFLFLNIEKLKYHWLTKNVSSLTTKNFNNFLIKVVLTKNINQEKTNNFQDLNINKNYDSYEKKYNKYKNKYLELKNQLGGWDCNCGNNYNNNLIYCQTCNKYNLSILESRLKNYGLSDQLITIIRGNISDINLVKLSDQQVETNILTLPQLNLAWTGLYSEPIIGTLELFITFIYVVNYYHSIGHNLGDIPQINSLCDQMVKIQGNFNIMRLANAVESTNNHPLIASFSVPISQLVNSKNNNILFDGTPYNYLNQFEITKGQLPLQRRFDLGIPFDINKFTNNTWRNEILFKHIFIHYGAHNGMRWETINIFENLARKINNINNIWKYEILQFIHSYLHVLDGLNYDIVYRDYVDLIDGNIGHIPDLNTCRVTLHNNPNCVQIINQIEQAFNFNCSHYLLKDINSNYYHNPYYIKNMFIAEKRRQYKTAVDLNTDVVPEPDILPPDAQTTDISFCLGMVPRN
jgi:hypothetical protein